MIRTHLAKAGRGLAASAALLGGLAAPQAASAQQPGYYGRDYQGGYAQNRYDCRERKNSNAVAGAIIGGIAGAVIGSNVAGRGDRGAGTAIGGIGGAAVGAGIGSSSTDCYGGRPAGYYGNGYYNRGYYGGGYYGGGYAGRPYYNGGYYGGRGYYGGGYAAPYNGGAYVHDRDDGYRHDRDDNDGYRNAPPPRTYDRDGDGD